MLPLQTSAQGWAWQTLPVHTELGEGRGSRAGWCCAPSFCTETSHRPAPPDLGSPSLSACSPCSPPLLYVGRERRVFLLRLLPNPSVQAQLVKFEKLKSEPSSFQRSERSQQGGTRLSMGLLKKVFHLLTGTQLLLLVRLNGEGPNTYSVSAANLQILCVYNTKSQVGVQMSARS